MWRNRSPEQAKKKIKNKKEMNGGNKLFQHANLIDTCCICACVCVCVCVCVGVLGIDGVLSPCHHGDKRSLTVRGERVTAFISIILTYNSVCERVCVCVRVCTLRG